MKKPFLIANWKMNMLSADAAEFIKHVKPSPDLEIIIAPPFTLIGGLAHYVKTMNEDASIHIAAQNLFYEEKGSFTGEVSGKMVADAGASYVLVGHSERRKHAAESDDVINKKIHAAIAAELIPILCIGERKDELDAGQKEEVLRRQLLQGLASVPKEQRLLVAYEPVWAIGSGHTPTVEDIEKTHALILQILDEIYDDPLYRAPILYGGSVNIDDIDDIIPIKGVEGVLVGGASLDYQHFRALRDEIIAHIDRQRREF